MWNMKLNVRILTKLIKGAKSLSEKLRNKTMLMGTVVYLRQVLEIISLIKICNLLTLLTFIHGGAGHLRTTLMLANTCVYILLYSAVSHAVSHINCN